MALNNNVSKLNVLEDKKNVSGIAGLDKVNGRVYDDLAERDAGFSKYHEQIFRDQLLANTRLLQYYHQLSSKDKIACSLQKLALKALHKIYSFKLRPAGLSEAPCLETLLQIELLEIINQPYGIHGDGYYPGDATKVASPNSPLWELNDWSLKLTRVLIDNSLLSAVMAKVVENHLTNLLDTIRNYQLKGQTCPGSSRSFALLAHCLCKLFEMNQHKDISQRRLLSPNFICDYLFPLACEFAAKEYPATIVDPISYYKLFKATGKLKEPDEMLTEWDRRRERRDASADSGGGGGGLKRDRSGKQLDSECGESDDHDSHPLPPTHACLEYLIYTLIVSSDADNQEVVVKFLQRKILELADANYDDSTDSCATGGELEARKLALMNKIVALNVLGRVKLHLKPSDMFNFLTVLVLPTLQQDCLLLKICKFQLIRSLEINDIELQGKILQAYFSEFIKLLRNTDEFHDQRHKLLLVFIAVASRCLYQFGEGLLRLLFSVVLAPLRRDSQLDLVKKIIALYFDYKIIDPLLLVRIVLDVNKADLSFNNECERQLTRVVDSITSRLLVLLPARKNHDKRDLVLQLLHHLFPVTNLRKQPLPDETVEKLLKLVQTCMLDADSSFHRDCNEFSWQTWNMSNLMCALKFPPQQQTQSSAVYLFDRLLEWFIEHKQIEVFKLTAATLILGNLGWYQVITSPPLVASSNGNNRAASAAAAIKNGARNLLFESPDRITRIYALCKCDEQSVDLTSSWIMSTLMSWPSSQASVGQRPPSPGASAPQAGESNTSQLYWMWQYFVELAHIRLDKFEAKENDEFNSRRRRTLCASALDIDDDDLQMFKTRDNLLFALIAAFNYEPRLLESYLSHAKGPADNSESHVRRYVKLWLDVVTRPDDVLWLQEMGDETFTARSYVHISYQTLIKIHQARVDGKLAFSIKGLTNQLNSARRIVLKWLADLNKQATSSNSPLTTFYADLIRQLEEIGNFK